ncbi:MAG: DUF1569 domain-containing protein [Vicinamibacterales bacterium]
MPSIWNDTDRGDLVRRAWMITPDHTAKWGTFNAAAMLAHLADSARMALGDLPVQAKAPKILKWAPVRYLVIHKLPMPKGAPTAPELLARCSTADLQHEQQALQSLFDALPRRATLAATHPAFGAMTRDDWGVLIHKHTDHHLRQFGV